MCFVALLCPITLIIQTINSRECLRSVSDLSFACADCIYSWNQRGTKSIRAIAQTLAIASTTIWTVLKKKETTGVLSNRPRTGRPRKAPAVDDRNIVTDVKKDPKTTVSNNLQRAGVKVSQSTVRRRLHEGAKTTH